MLMRIISINVGLPREVSWQGKVVTTGIYKEPVEGPVMLRTLNLDGDGQADLSVHGGPNMRAAGHEIAFGYVWGELHDGRPQRR